MPRGNIQKIMTNKGYGFIRAEDGKEIFFHISSLRGLESYGLKQGMAVEFDVEKKPSWT